MTDLIIGAGLAGLMAGALDRKARVVEAQASLPNNHHAVLRFREPKLANALGIPFRKVRVLKGVENGISPIADANRYSMKVSGKISSRSILNLEPGDRWIAPPNLIEQLAEMVGSRLELGHAVTREEIAQVVNSGGRVISTIPMPLMLKMTGVPHDPDEFRHSAVTVSKFLIEGDCDVYQTIYYPCQYDWFYRASITGNEMLMESMQSGPPPPHEVSLAANSFGIPGRALQPADLQRQTLGKIVPLPAERRKALLMALTVEHGVFSLGRYACWRNLLLDDVFDDYFKLRSIMALESQYDFRRTIA